MIHIGNHDYELLLTTGATKAIAKRYGGLENLGDKLMTSENFEQAISEVIWLIVLLANQAAKRKQLLDPSAEVKYLSEEELETLTTPADLAAFKEAITECLQVGTKRNIENIDPKNTKAS